MTDLEFLQKIAGEVCEGCGPTRDCGLEYDDCFRIDNAIDILKKYNQKDSADKREPCVDGCPKPYRPWESYCPVCGVERG